MTNLTAAEVSRVRVLLPKLEEAHIFPPQDVEALKRIIDLHDTYREEILAVVEGERTSKMWAKARTHVFKVVQWFLLTITGLAGTWLAFVSYWNGKQ